MGRLYTSFLSDAGRTPRFIAVLIVGIALIMSLVGCGSRLPLIGSKDIRLRVTARADLNNGGNALVVRLYKLSTDINFQLVTQKAFWEDDELALGPDLLEKREITLLPGETFYLNYEMEADSTYLAAAAHFFEPHQEKWRQVYRVGTNTDEWVRGRREVWLEVGSEKLAIRQAESIGLPAWPNRPFLPVAAVVEAAHSVLTGVPNWIMSSFQARGSAPRLNLNLVAGNDLNSGGNALTLRVYELSDSVRFHGADLKSLWVDDVRLLENDLIEKEEFTLMPGEIRQLEFEGARQANFIGLAAQFFHPQEEHWRLIYPAVAGRTTHVEAGSTGLSVTEMNSKIKPR